MSHLPADKVFAGGWQDTLPGLPVSLLPRNPFSMDDYVTLVPGAAYFNPTETDLYGCCLRQEMTSYCREPFSGIHDLCEKFHDRLPVGE